MALLVVLFIIVPIVEIYVIIQIGEAIGVVPTIALLLADALLGSLLLRHQGRGAWRRFNEAIAARRFPGREAADGVMIAVGGTLLLTPGFVSDIFGLMLLIPPSRALLRRLLRGYLGRRFVLVGVGGAPPPRGYGPPGGMGGYGAGAPPGAAPRRDYDFEGTAEEVNGDDPRIQSG